MAGGDATVGQLLADQGANSILQLGSGSLTVTGSSTVNTGNVVTVGNGTAPASLTVLAGNHTFTGAGTGLEVSTNGSLLVDKNAVLTTPTLVVDAGGTASVGAGTLRVTDQLTYNGSTLSVGSNDSASRLEITGTKYHTVDGTLGSAKNGVLYIAGGTLTANMLQMNGGTMTVTGSSTQLHTTSGTIGGADVNATAVLQSGAKWSNGDSLIIGDKVDGALQVNSGATLQSSGVFVKLADTAGVNGSLSVSDAGSKAIASQFVVGNQGTGSVTVAQGGLVEGLAGGKAAFVLGVGASSQGSLTINDAASTVKAGSMYVGVAGTGSLAMHDGTLTADSVFAGDKGTINISGGQTSFGSLNVPSAATFTFSGGTVGWSNASFGGNLAVGDGSSTPAILSIGSNNGWTTVNGTATVSSNATVTMLGGGLSAQSLQGTGAFQFNAGSVTIRSDAQLGPSSARLAPI